MRYLNSKMLLYVSVFLVACIVVVIVLLFTKNAHGMSVQYYIPGNLSNVGCLSVFVDGASEENEFSFDNGVNWQKNNYGIVYGKTTILVRNADKEVVYSEDVSEEGFVSDAPVIKMNFDSQVATTRDADLVKNVKASLNGKDLTSNIKTYVLEQKDDELLVSYLINSDIKRCYVVRKTSIDHNLTPEPTPTNSDNNKTEDKWTWPTKKPYKISSTYGWRGKKFHRGVDIAGLKRGSPIYAARNGEVTAITSNSSSGYYVIIKHDNGYYTRYAHMQNTNGNDKLGKTGSAEKYIFVGLRVKAGDTIGEIGSSGNSSGPHLHFEIWNGKPFSAKSYNPLNFYKK